MPMASPLEATMPSCDVPRFGMNPANWRCACVRWSVTYGLIVAQKDATSLLQLKIATRSSTHEKICANCAGVYFTEPLLTSPHCAIHQPMVCGQLAKHTCSWTSLY